MSQGTDSQYEISEWRQVMPGDDASFLIEEREKIRHKVCFFHMTQLRQQHLIFEPPITHRVVCFFRFDVRVNKWFSFWFIPSGLIREKTWKCILLRIQFLS